MKRYRPLPSPGIGVFPAFCASLLLGGLLTAVPVRAQVLDQSFTGLLNLGANINEGKRFVAQTYTAGLNGQLTGVSISIFNGGSPSIPLRLLVLDTVSGTPTSSILGSADLPTNTVDISTVIPLGRNVRQVAGHTYALAVFAPTAQPPGAGHGVGGWDGFVGGTDPYPGGGFYFADTLTGWQFSKVPNGDLFFKTFVDPSVAPAAPEPVSLALLLAPVGLLFFARRHRGFSSVATRR